MNQIIAQKYSNPITPSPHPQNELLYCRDGSDLTRGVEDLRENLVLNDSPRRNASFARRLARILRRKHQHVAHCSVCILQEVFNGRLPQ